ncbi:hypothetical protein [Rhodococcus sp. WS1]|uniref:hypothetical protein n=1 Tax=Rhodococcus sp. WS1 TaxID=1882743 RepID=UPI0039679785
MPDLLLARLRAARPDLDIDRYLTPRGTAIGDLVNRPLDDPAVLAAARGMLEIPTTGYDRQVFLGQGLTDEMMPAPLALKLAANRQPVTFRTYPTGHIETMRAALPESLSFASNFFEP